MNVYDNKEPQTGFTALILIVGILVLLVFIADIKIDVGDDDEEIIEGSRTIHELNDWGNISCSQCVNNCQWTTLRSESDCQEGCIPNKDCDPELDID